MKDPMKSIPFLPKLFQGWGGVGWVGHARVGWGGVGWVMQGLGWGGSCKGGVGWVMQRWGGVGWVMQG